MQIRDVYEGQGRKMFTLDSDHTLEDAINVMAQRDTDGLIVTEKDRPAGIITERDVMRCYLQFDRKPFTEIKLKDAMTNKLVVAKPEDDLDATISMMVQANIRHLPVVEQGEITAMLFICDLIQHQVGILSTELRYLEDYLADLHEAGKD